MSTQVEGNYPKVTFPTESHYVTRPRGRIVEIGDGPSFTIRSSLSRRYRPQGPEYLNSQRSPSQIMSSPMAVRLSW